MYSAFTRTRTAFLADDLTLASGDVVRDRNQCFNQFRSFQFILVHPFANGYNAEGVPTLI